MKRKAEAMEITEDQRRRALLVPGASESAVRQIAEIIVGQKQNVQEWKCFKRNVLQPFEKSFDTIFLKKKKMAKIFHFCVPALRKL